MSSIEQRSSERRRMTLLAPLMIVANAFLFLSMAVLAAMALNGGEGMGIIATGVDANRQIVREHLARSVPDETYRIRQWFPAEPLAVNRDGGGDPSQPTTGKGVAQRVKLAVYGPNGAKDLDTIFWIQNGSVTRVLEADGFRAGHAL